MRIEIDGKRISAGTGKKWEQPLEGDLRTFVSECEKGSRLFIKVLKKLRLSEREIIVKCYVSYACILNFLSTFHLALHTGQCAAPVCIRRGLPYEGECFPSLKWEVVVFST